MNDWYPKEFEFPITLTYPKTFECPITRTIMKDPVRADDGYNYEKLAITKWLNTLESLDTQATSPISRVPISKSTLTRNIELCKEIEEWFEKNVTQVIAEDPAPATMAASAKPAPQDPATKTALGAALVKAPAPATMAASARPAPQAPATKTAPGAAMVKTPAPETRVTPSKSAPESLAATTAQAQARMAAQPRNTAVVDAKTVFYLFRQNLYNLTLEKKILSQVSNF